MHKITLRTMKCEIATLQYGVANGYVPTVSFTPKSKTNADMSCRFTIKTTNYSYEEVDLPS